ncbi:substrate-binding and VWA domain-containing protein [Kribbella qitaiheensis]|uniref:substrate-binding and VWA domain-containing protein n=1 Tax=Kribbella qitaiheensis TaxID=1544730 RepID=UPI001FE9CABA|nr:substrate-binding and VWA domain-containing protein [Kribbella qitaiheensis]
MTKSNNNRRPVYLTAVGLLVLSLGAVFVVRSFGSESGADGFLGGGSCDDPTQIQLHTTPEIQPQLEAAAKALSAKKDKDAPCLQFTITAVPSASDARNIANGADNKPDLWVPDSSAWVAQADDGQSVPTVVVPSIASSPLVLVGRNENFANVSSWLGSFQGTKPALLDPLTQSSGLLALLAVGAERTKTSAADSLVSSVMVPLAQRLGSLAQPYKEVDGLLGRAAAEGSPVVVPTSEQAFVKYQEEHPDAELKAIVPATGTLLFDYPIAVTAKSDNTVITEAAKSLAAEMLSDASSQARDDAGFRDSLLSPLGGGRGVGDITQLTKPNASVVEKALLNWTRLSLTAHSLAVIDVSGSMNEKVGGKTRMQLTIAAATQGLKLFPDNAALGLWSFSTSIGPNKEDFRQLVPIAPLTPAQRSKMLASLTAQSAIPNGGTGLYATAIAAVKAVKQNYDSSAVNAVMLFTDGKNDDPNGPTLTATIRTLEGMRDPAQPVRIIALGMGPDVDGNELGQLAAATGGLSYVARNPTDLQGVFINALQSR